MILESSESIQVLLACAVHPEDVKVVVLWVAMQPVRHIGCATASGIENELSVDRSKHITSRKEQVVLVLGHLANDGVAAQRHVDDESARLHLDHSEALFAFLLFVLIFYF